MVVFILIVIIVVLAWYSYDTRARLTNVANTIDRINDIIAKEILADRAKIAKLEENILFLRKQSSFKSKK